MTGGVLDASAILALIFDEPGGEAVAEHLDGGTITAIGLAEVLTKHLDRGLETDGVARDLVALGVRVEPVTAADAEGQLELRRLDLARSDGGARLSMADRTCLAVAWRLGRPVLTADRLWAELDLPVEVILVR